MNVSRALIPLVLTAMAGVIVWQSLPWKPEKAKDFAVPSKPAKASGPAKPERHQPEFPALDPPPGAASSIPPSPLANALLAMDGTPRRDLDTVLQLLDFYRSEFGAYPAGGNREIVNALRGSNPQSLPILPGTHPAISPRGELLDRWGTPFFFHQVSSEAMEIRTAGEDRRLFSEDDLEVKTGALKAKTHQPADPNTADRALNMSERNAAPR